MTTEQLSKLSPEEKRVKIAEACGWFAVRTFQYHGVILVGDHPEATDDQRNFPDGRGAWLAMVPDYYNDLNAMHEAIKTQCEFALFRFTYTTNLRKVINPENWGMVTEFRLLNSEASEQADAFLLTIGGEE